MDTAPTIVKKLNSFNTNFCFIFCVVFVLFVFAIPVAMATKITQDAENPTPVSYKWSKVTFSLSRTVFELFAIFFIVGFPMYLGPPNCFSPKIPLNDQVSTRPQKALPRVGTRVLEHQARRFGAPCDQCARKRKSVKNASSSIYFNPSPRRPPKGCKFETLPASSDPEAINPDNFQLDQLDLPSSVGSTGGGSKLAYETTTPITNIIIIYNARSVTEK